MRSFAIGAALFLVVTLLALEIGSALFFELGLSPMTYRPEVWASSQDPPPEETWRIENQPWGAWHKSNAISGHSRSCYSEIYASNEIGARDRNFDQVFAGRPRIFGLGDSFMEGYGVARSARFDEAIESGGFDFLNFGAAGNFGPVQYSLIYDHFGDQYPHDAVVIFFLPDNDYTDNDPGFWQANESSYSFRYRPYYRVTTAGDYAIDYPIAAPDRVVTFADLEFADLGLLAGVARLYKQYTYSYGAIRYGVRLAEAYANVGEHYSGYYDATDEQLDAARFFLTKIIERAKAAGSKPVIIFSIARLQDFRRAASEDGEPRSSAMLRTLADRHDAVRFVDGLTAMPKIEPDVERYFFSCDGHWSSYGHEIAGRIIEQILRQELGFDPSVAASANYDRAPGSRRR